MALPVTSRGRNGEPAPVGPGPAEGVAVGVEADAAREERDDGDVAVGDVLEAREVEKRGAFEKEPALLGKEQRVLREIDLPLIDFGLREVRVDGEIGAQRRRDAVVQVGASIRIGRRGGLAATG